MKYRITHKTNYDSHESVSIGHNQAWLELRSVSWQQVDTFSLTIDPEPSICMRRIDSFRNPVHLFSFNEGYQRLSVTATSVVTVTEMPLPESQLSLPWEQLASGVRNHATSEDRDAAEFEFASPRIFWSADKRRYAMESFLPGRSMRDALLDLTSRIHTEFVYDSRATTVNTPVDEVFRLGIPARYVSGYLRTVPPEGQPRLVGADASHAWLSAYCGNGQWLDVDPTNNTICSTDHITLAWGRDYGDVPPLTGVFIGGGKHRLVVNVDVLPLP